MYMRLVKILRLTFVAIVIGLLSGVSIGVFLILLEKSINLNLTYYNLIWFLPVSGSLMTFLYKKFGGNSNKGNNIIIENINGSNEEIKFIMAPLVFIGTVLTHLFGGSVGREGTGVQIGGTIANSLCKLLNYKEDKKILLITGMAAGFSSVFGTPLAGTIFALEVSAIGSISYNSMLPAITAAIVGDRVVRFLGVKHTHFDFPPVEPFLFTNIFRVIVMSICFGLVSRLFIEMTKLFKYILGKYIKNNYLKAFIGGSLMAIVTLIIGNRVYNNLSLGLLTGAFDKEVPYFAFLIKLVLTTLCLGAGYQGGEVTPLFVIGTTLGSTLANIFEVPRAVAASLGLVGVFAGATNAPIACFIMYIELFGSVNIVFAMVVCIISVIISGKKGIYSSQLWIE